jgi:hypothetical protein
MRRRVLLARALKNPDEMVDVRVPSRPLTNDEGIELALRLNRNTGQWDFDALANDFDLDFLKSVGFEDNDFGFHAPVEVGDKTDGEGFAAGAQFSVDGVAAIIPLTQAQANDADLKQALSAFCDAHGLVYQIKRG